MFLYYLLRPIDALFTDNETIAECNEKELSEGAKFSGTLKNKLLKFLISIELKNQQY